MSPKDTRNWDDLASLLFPDETVESCGLLSPPLHTVSSSDAERSVQDIEGGTQRESSDQTIDEVLMDRKLSCITLADKIAFVLEFKLQGKGIVGQIVDILIEEFYHNPPVGSANQKLRYVSRTSLCFVEMTDPRSYRAKEERFQQFVQPELLQKAGTRPKCFNSLPSMEIRP